MRDQQETYIYESPDNGQTVYRRPFGGSISEKEIHYISDEKRSLYEQIQEDKLWGQIRRAAKTDPALKELLDRAVIYYQLKSQP